MMVRALRGSDFETDEITSANIQLFRASKDKKEQLLKDIEMYDASITWCIFLGDDEALHLELAKMKSYAIREFTLASKIHWYTEQISNDLEEFYGRKVIVIYGVKIAQ